MAKPPYRPIGLAAPAIETIPLADGGLLIRSRTALGPYPQSIGSHLRHWAAAAPDRVFLAERESDGSWRRIAYGAALDAVERLAQALIDRGLGPDRPVAILSGNGIDNGLLQLAALHSGVPVVPVSPAYALMSQDFAQLKYILDLVGPGLVYAAAGRPFARAIAAAVPADAELVVSADPPTGRAATPFASLLAAAPGPAVEAAFAKVGPDTVAKILFTSGSTGRPKGVINTQRMLCSNQQAAAQIWPFLDARPPVIVDWLPWNHTFGGNFNFNMILRSGGTIYIDAGKPAPGLFDATLGNLREVPSTMHFNVPRGYDMLIPHLERDPALRATFFRDLDMIFYAAAALPQHLWDKLEQLSLEATGRRIVMLSAWGSTETAPLATAVHWPIERAGVIGVPVPGVEIKLVPEGSKLELRVRGPNVTPGYFRRPELRAETFDADGFVRMGDAGVFADPARPEAGLLFDGRLGENFKLMSGVFVQVGALRTELITAGAPVVQDLVVAGEGREDIGVLIFPNLAGCRSLCPEAADAPLEALIGRPEVRARLSAGLAAHNRANPSNSRRVACALLMAEPPSIDANEITDKGYINQRAVLARRAALVERMYGAGAATDVIRLDRDAVSELNTAERGKVHA